MTQTAKDLLLKDLCGRLPYRVKVQIKNEIVVLDSICDDDGYHFNFIGEDREGVNIENIKPYLFPLSSMTEEQKEEWKSLLIREAFGTSDNVFTPQDFYNKNHIDYRGLIPMGLAEDATGKNVY
jgi:hypothetical protein